MKIALVYPRYRYPSGDPPLGVATLSGILGAMGVDHDVFDPTFEKRPRSWLLDRMAEKAYDVVGISAMVTQIADAFEVARTVKFFHPYTKVVIGGPQATVMPAETLKRPEVDAVCVGEGESVIRAIAERNGSIEDIPGLWFKRGGEIVEHPACDESQFDSNPPPDFGKLPMEGYFANWFQLDSVERGLRGLPVMASRGCPYHCTYCQPTLEKIFGRGLRKRSPERIVDELASHKAKYGITAFLFVDDTFPADRKWAMSVCSAIEAASLGLVWGANIRADLAEEELLAAMKRAGLRKIFLGVESSSDRILKDVYRKGIKIEQARNAAALAKKLGLAVQGYFMMGAPTETIDEIRGTAKLAREMPIDDAVFNIATPLPGTELFDRFKDRIDIPVEDMDYYGSYPWKPGVTVPEGALKREKLKAFAGFYLSKGRAGRTIGSVLSPGGLKTMALKLKRVF